MCESVCGGTHMSIVSECRSVRMLVCCELVSVSGCISESDWGTECICECTSMCMMV